MNESVILTKPEAVVRTMIRRIRDDGRIAYLIGPGSQTYDEITEAYAEMVGMNVDAFRGEFERVLRPQRVITVPPEDESV